MTDTQATEEVAPAQRPGRRLLRLAGIAAVLFLAAAALLNLLNIHVEITPMWASDAPSEEEWRDTGEGVYEQDLDSAPVQAACGPGEQARFQTLQAQRQPLVQQRMALQSQVSANANNPQAVADIGRQQMALDQQIRAIDGEMAALRQQCS